MTVAGSTARLSTRGRSLALAGAKVSRRKRFVFFVLGNLLVFAAIFVVAELAFRLFWSPRYWTHTGRLMVGSGQTEVGKKWWPSTTYAVDGTEFRTVFRTDASGYRARSQAFAAEHPDRIAFVGDSFTEAMQVPYDASFCARLERLFNQGPAARPRVCLNYGISATDLFDYWHRIVHDVLREDPPEALVLCIYPGNDFQPTPPADGFDADGRPLRDHFKKPGWGKHLVAWINLHSKFGFFLQRSLLSWGAASLRPDPKLKNWWTDPRILTKVEDAPAVQRYRSLFRAIDEECRRRGTKLVVLVVGPVANYAAKDGESPLARILSSWGIDVPVIDVAIRGRARSDWASLVFPFDGHLNDAGHAYLAQEAIVPLRAVLDGQGRTAQR